MCVIILETIIDGAKKLIQYLYSNFASKKDCGEDVFYDHQCVEDLSSEINDKAPDEFCRVYCECGAVNHIAKKICDNCGHQKIKKAIDWKHMKEKAPKCPYYTTKCLFKRACQLHSRHKRDVVILIHHKSNKKDMFRVWGTPGSAERMFEGQLGKALKDAFVYNFTEPKLSEKRPASPSEIPRTHKKRKTDAVEKRHPTPAKTQQISKTAESNNNVGNVVGTKGDVAHVALNANDTADTQLCDKDGDSDEEVYMVQEVLGKRVTDGKIEYFVKWAGWSSDFNTWEPECNFFDKSLLEKFQ